MIEETFDLITNLTESPRPTPARPAYFLSFRTVLLWIIRRSKPDFSTIQTGRGRENHWKPGPDNPT